MEKSWRSIEQIERQNIINEFFVSSLLFSFRANSAVSLIDNKYFWVVFYYVFDLHFALLRQHFQHSDRNWNSIIMFELLFEMLSIQDLWHKRFGLCSAFAPNKPIGRTVGGWHKWLALATARTNSAEQHSDWTVSLRTRLGSDRIYSSDSDAIRVQ